MTQVWITKHSQEMGKFCEVINFTILTKEKFGRVPVIKKQQMMTRLGPCHPWTISSDWHWRSSNQLGGSSLAKLSTILVSLTHADPPLVFTGWDGSSCDSS